MGDRSAARAIGPGWIQGRTTSSPLEPPSEIGLTGPAPGLKGESHAVLPDWRLVVFVSRAGAGRSPGWRSAGKRLWLMENLSGGTPNEENGFVLCGGVVGRSGLDAASPSASNRLRSRLRNLSNTTITTPNNPIHAPLENVSTSNIKPVQSRTPSQKLDLWLTRNRVKGPASNATMNIPRMLGWGRVP